MNLIIRFTFISRNVIIFHILWEKAFIQIKDLVYYSKTSKTSKLLRSISLHHSLSANRFIILSDLNISKLVLAVEYYTADCFEDGANHSHDQNTAQSLPDQMQ